METAHIGQRVKYISSENGEIYYGTVKDTRIMDSPYMINYQRAEVDIDSYIAEAHIFTMVECNTRFLDYC